MGNSPRLIRVGAGRALLAWVALLLPSPDSLAGSEPLFPPGVPLIRLVPPPGIGVNKEPFRDLFEHPDEWVEARNLIHAIGYYDHAINRYSDAELTEWFALIKEWDKKLFIETGALKEWCQSAQACFDAVSPLYDRFLSLGARIDAFSMDEPLINVLANGYGDYAFAVNQTAEWIRMVREKYPDTAIGSIEPYPAIPLDDLKNWILDLNARLAELNVRGLDFFCLDPDWIRFNHDGNWSEVKQLELFCRGLGLPFSLIYWASDHTPYSSDASWTYSVLQQGREYRAVGGKPDEYDIQSWLPFPNNMVPETLDFSFTHFVRNFHGQIVATPTPTVTRTPIPTVTPSGTFTATLSPTLTATPTPSLSPTLTATPSPTETPNPHDLNGDGTVDFLDLFHFQEEWRKSSGVSQQEE
ncbi:MAG: hypothetical protein HUU16_06910 [Candidatus Omnitrophica bacterium]|nr:hypothetical protein [Candidatus Omnitrophota bacterium]